MLKRILLDILGSLFVSFITTFMFFYIFSKGQLTDFSTKFETILKLSNFWIAFGLWSILFFLLFFLPIGLLIQKKETKS